MRSNVLKIWWCGGVKVHKYGKCGKLEIQVDGAEHLAWTGGLPYQIKELSWWD